MFLIFLLFSNLHDYSKVCHMMNAYFSHTSVRLAHDAGRGLRQHPS